MKCNASSWAHMIHMLQETNHVMMHNPKQCWTILQCYIKPLHYHANKLATPIRNKPKGHDAMFLKPTQAKAMDLLLQSHKLHNIAPYYTSEPMEKNMSWTKELNYLQQVRTTTNYEPRGRLQNIRYILYQNHNQNCITKSESQTSSHTDLLHQNHHKLICTTHPNKTQHVKASLQALHHKSTMNHLIEYHTSLTHELTWLNPQNQSKSLTTIKLT